MSKEKIMFKLEERWQEFLHSFEMLSESQMTRPARDGGWSIKDILVHVRAWEDEALKYLPTIIEGQRLPRYKDLYGGINAFNAMTHNANKDLALKTVLANLQETHQRLLVYLQLIPNEHFASGTRFLRRLAADTYNHYPEHTETIINLHK
ncbi:MAG: DinB family protein [Chloroflexi bacterium]|nr:DinB family protein [Chloroflexota bacterium]